MVRQLAPVSESNREWFQEFLKRITWKFFSPEDIFSKPDFLMDAESVSLACEAGEKLEVLLNQSKPGVPTYYELYNPKADHLRISDFKRVGKISERLKSANHWSYLEIRPMNKFPPVYIEIGHVFDEYFRLVFEQNPPSKWAQGRRVEFYCEELDLRIGGSPDLFYNGIPVEMKTRPVLPFIKDKSFDLSWKKSYLPQIAMYSDACGLDWMFILLISRETGQFSLIPVSCKAKLAEMKEAWRKHLTRNGVFMEHVARYKFIHS